jgi:hypothetical protein
MLDHTSFVLWELKQKWRARIIKDGFRPHLDGILADIKHVWTTRQELPFVILSRMPNGVDYWEPRYDRSIRSIVAISLSLQNLVRLGLTEALHIYEAAGKTEDFLIVQLSTRDNRMFQTWSIRHGSKRKWLQEEKFDPGKINNDPGKINNPMLNPWNTNKDITAFTGVPGATLEKCAEFIAANYSIPQREGWLRLAPDS